MSNGCRFQTCSFPSRVPKGTRRFLMRRPAVYYSNKGIYFDVHLVYSTSINHIYNKHSITTTQNIPPDKYTRSWIKQHNPNIV